MTFKGRTVIAFIFLAIFASSITTLTLVGAGGSYFSKQEKAQTEDISHLEASLGRSANGSKKEALTQADLNKIMTTYGLIEHKFVNKVEHQKVVDGAIHGMLAALEDPYTTYMDLTEAQQYTESVDSYFTGIGAEVTMDNGKVTVMSPIKGSPAEKAGIHAKDVILSVNGENLDGLNLNEAVLKIRGPKGTQAKLQIVRGGVGEPIEIIVVRDEIDIETVYAEMMDHGIGRIELNQFSMNTVERFQEELKNLESKGMKGLVIDVRNNPGGYLSGVLKIIESLVPKDKTLVQIEYRDQERTKTVSEGDGKPYPIAVLINEGSASASEILAAALHESAGSKLFGHKSFGKGTVQTTYEKELGDGTNIKLTIAKWLTPNGNWIHQKGIEPDFHVDQPLYFSVAPLSLEKTMKPDTIGEDNKNLQLMLGGLGFNPGRTDGYYSDQTAIAVKNYQQAHSLPVTGEVDNKTAESIEQAIVKQIRNPQNDQQLKEAVKYLQGAAVSR